MARGPSEDSTEGATEEPTPRRLAEARRRGEIAYSRELSSAAALVAAVAVLAWDAPALVGRAVATMRLTLAEAVAGGGVPPAALALGGSLALRALAPALGAVLLVALAAGLAQTRGLILAPVRVDLGRLARGASWRRVFDGRAALVSAQGLVKVLLVGAVAALALRPAAGALVALTGASADRVLATLGALAARLAVRVAVAALAFGVVDALLAARRHRRALRMTRAQVKRELRESEGDPAHRGARQRLHREILEQRRLEDVRRADLVVVNPELAVALRYDPAGEPAGDAAPVVVARGEHLAAERIQQIARLAGVPIFRDVGLARALGALAAGGEIPAALYEAVAELLRIAQGPGPGAPAAGAPARARAHGRGVTWKRV